MNPFLESTVAAPLPSTVRRRHGEPQSWTHAGRDGDARRRIARGMVALRRSLCLAGAAAIMGWSAVAHAIDVNIATQEQLLSVRGIGPKTAQTIIEERGRGGRFLSFEDLSDRVKGIGPKKSAGLQAAGLTIGNGAVQPAPATPIAAEKTGQPARRTR